MSWYTYDLKSGQLLTITDRLDAAEAWVSEIVESPIVREKMERGVYTLWSSPASELDNTERVAVVHHEPLDGLPVPIYPDVMVPRFRLTDFQRAQVYSISVDDTTATIPPAGQRVPIILGLAALGMTSTSIARRLGTSRVYVGKVLGDPRKFITLTHSADTVDA